MGDSGDAARQLDNWQKVVEYSLAVITPTVLALMMFSLIVTPSLPGEVVLLVGAASASTIFPALMAQRLHYRCWAPNTMPQRMMSALFGTIYISLVAVLSVSLVSTSHGLEPGQPLTFAVVATLLAHGCAGLSLEERRSTWTYVTSEGRPRTSARPSGRPWSRRLASGRRGRAAPGWWSRPARRHIASCPRRSTEVIIARRAVGKETANASKNARRLGAAV